MLSVQEVHDKVLYPVVRVRSGNAGGSGVLIYSEPDPQDPSRYINIALTCQHVVDTAIKIREEFDPVLKQQRKTDYFEEVIIEVFDYQGSKLISSNATNAEIIAYDKHHDLAAVKLNNPRQMLYAASVIPKDDIQNIRIAAPVVTCGCSLLHDPFPNNGTLTYLREMIEQKSYIMANAPSIFGNCLPKDTLVSLSNGSVKKISDVEAGERVWAISPEAGLQQCTVEEQINAGVKPIFKVKTRTRTVRASGNHPFLTLRTTQRWGGKNVNWLDWVKLEDLNEGDVIAVLPGLPGREKGEGIRFADYIGQDNNPQDLMTLLGFYVGDGWIRYREGQSYEVGLATYDDALTEKYKSLLTSLFDVQNFGNETDSIKVYSKELVDTFITLGVTGTSTERSIPDWVMTQPYDLQLAFINGYLEADGHVDKNGSWVFEANNADLIRKLRMLCIHLGFNISNIFERMREPLSIMERDTAPTSASFSFQVYPAFSKNRSTYIQGDTSLLTDQLVYERISKIIPDGEEATFDLKIKDAHNFMADGVVVHNSGGGLFHGDTGHLLGLTSRVTVTQLGFGLDVQTWMNFSTHPDRLYEFFEHQELQFLYDDTDDYHAAMERRDAKRRNALRAILFEEHETGETPVTG